MTLRPGRRGERKRKVWEGESNIDRECRSGEAGKDSVTSITVPGSRQ